MKYSIWVLVVVLIVAFGLGDIIDRRRRAATLGAARLPNPFIRDFVEENSTCQDVTVRDQDFQVQFTPAFDPYITQQGQARPRIVYNDITEKTKGLYFIIDKQDKELVYVGYSFSANTLYKTLYRHFQSWQDKKQYRFTLPKQGYEIVLCLSDNPRIAEMEKYYIQRYRPRGNAIQYELHFNSSEGLDYKVIAPDLPFISNIPQEVYYIEPIPELPPEWQEETEPAPF